MKRPLHVVLLHAYSRRNSGDGLLVDLSIELLREAFGADTRTTIVAADPDSFADAGCTLGAPVLAQRGIASRIAAAARGWLTARTPAALAPVLADADLIVGVGGGYLRARTIAQALRLEVGHLLQLRAARASGKPAVYLPQSIGPARIGLPIASRAWRARLAALLGWCTTVFVRDERSLAMLSGNANTLRAPDLAVLAFATRHPRPAVAPRVNAPVRHVALVLRAAPSWSRAQCTRYRRAIDRLVARIEARSRITFALQSTGRGNDDTAFYRRLGIAHPLPSLRRVLAEDPPDFVVSVRLHGALESILAGVPAFHLSYERKGFGAYADLGLNDWVVNAADFDADAVADHIYGPSAALRFWNAATNRTCVLQAQRAHVIAALRDAVRTRPC
ncbi:polysaccharide pyruvyl transferase family protein [Burkholderia stagnalis]|uniref:Polysaccharide pyruvyl transferase family protein n=1 Tax=Burkholderia stagnalis TaxID=1503054 RepID=A0ABX9YD06_9BURK|nr:polysaccharide pyruvyl transferase family protein [Burkholderia stagnalis]RQQ47554.1 polysaccharide pyruvyl transferase family protein [Burkholderia stagnalis]RQQ59047.1 polysaccharide pyruvyl transferase family protein [Burkholderia stagnalis]RQQ59578.1 polysaccharide pyruvyl transferase family protein [Burkholderia stagnalis]RQQ73881.1 polysaccharide pyruvyl transferase family protein [Burkholderia stagnalis]RQQ79667.1 polysaccharide pyruvyl transferase family protein [Burkholderia stagna